MILTKIAADLWSKNGSINAKGLHADLCASQSLLPYYRVQWLLSLLTFMRWRCNI